MIELESLAEFDAHVADAASLSGTASQGLDLSERTTTLLSVPLHGAFFLGCTIEPQAMCAVGDGGAVVFPSFPDLPFKAFRSSLYTPEELYEGYLPGQHETYDATIDGRTYAWHTKVIETSDVVATLAERVHDHAVDDALEGLLEEIGRPQVVAVMGGHAMTRNEDAYRSVALLGRSLTRAGFYVATGGGPGAMEAANFGAWMAAFDDDQLDEALALLNQAPTFEPVGEWLDTGFAVRERWPQPTNDPVSIGVPTWHYGHEPPNVFPTEVAKYFANSIREEGLLAIALGGVVFAPGSAGTIQEVFQDAAQNHYKSFGIASPMVFFDVEFWTDTKPVYPLLAQLAEGREYAEGLTAIDDVDAIVAHIRAHQ